MDARLLLGSFGFSSKSMIFLFSSAITMPNRLASLALGTGDIDCVYHFALYELIRAVKEVGSEDAAETLETLVQGKRLKDISDLPLDLAV